MSNIPARERARRREERQPPLFLVTGLVIGLVLGLLVAWQFWPAGAGAIDPSQLGERDQDRYRAAIALAYAASGDLGRAQARLDLLEDSDPARTLRNQAQALLLQSDAQRQARALSQLADALDGSLLATSTPEADRVTTPSPFPSPEEN